MIGLSQNYACKFDVTVVGGGAAGCAAARFLAEAGRTVALVESKGIGSQAHTPVTFTETLRDFGLEAAVHIFYRRLSYHSPTGALSTLEMGEPAWGCVDYRKACRLLWHAAEEAGAVLIQARAKSLRKSGQGLEILLDSEAALRSTVVIDATGKARFSGHILGQPDPRYYSHSLGRRVSGAAVADENNFYLIAPGAASGTGGGWFYPLGQGKAVLGFAAVTRSPFAPWSRLAVIWRKAARSLRPYSEMLRNARPGHFEMGSIPLVAPRRFVFGRIAVVGDAAAQATPWSCFGVHAALLNAKLVARAVLRASQDGDSAERHLLAYQRDWKTQNGLAYRLGDLCAGSLWWRDEREWALDVARFGELPPEAALSRIRDGSVPRCAPLARSIVWRMIMTGYMIKCRAAELLRQARFEQADLGVGDP